MSGRQEKDDVILRDRLRQLAPSELDREDLEETVEVKLPPSHNTKLEGDVSKKIVTFEKLLKNLAEQVEELSSEHADALRRISLTLGDSQLALKNSDHSMKEVKKLRKDTEESLVEVRDFIEEMKKSGGVPGSTSTVPLVEDSQPSEKFNLTIADILERISVLEDLPDRVDERHSSLAESLENIAEDISTLKEHVDDAAGRADTSLERVEKVRDQFEQVAALKERVDHLDSEFKKGVQAATPSPLSDKRLQEIQSTVEKLKIIFDEKVEFTEDQYEFLKVFLAENIKVLESKLKGIREDFKEKLETLQNRLGEQFSQSTEIVEMRRIMEELRTSGGDKVAHLERIVEDQAHKIKKLTDMLKNFEESLQYSEMALSSLVTQRVEKIIDQISHTERKLNEVTAVQKKAQEDIENLIKSGGGSSEAQKQMMDELAEKVNQMSGAVTGNVAEHLKTLEEQLAEVKTRFETGFAQRLAPLELQIKDISGDLDVKLEPIRKEVAAVKSFIEEEMIKVKESWDKVEQTIASSEGAMDIAVKAKDSLERLNLEVSEAMKKIDHLMTSIRENTLLTDSNYEKIDLTIKLVDEARERVKALSAPVVSVGAMAEDELTLTNKEILEDPDTSDLDFELDDLLMVMLQHKASDLHLKAGAPPTVRLDGELIPVGNQVLTDYDTKKLVLSAMTSGLRRQLARKREVDFAYAIPEARFRVNAFLQKQSISAAFRLLWTEIPTIEKLNLPPVLKKLCDYNHGLILITGPAGSGKSTTLSAMINYINETKKMHIVTVEDPIEFIHADKMSIITQREVGTDTESFGVALKQALRQDPNVILIGEMRDPETIMTAAVAAETGHLVLSTLHTPNTVQAISRIIDVFSGDVQKQFRLLLAGTLRGIVSQRLLARADGSGRIPSVEVMVCTPTISSLIMEERTGDIYELITAGEIEGMQTFTQSLTKLYERGLISKDEAMFHADHPTEFRMIVEGHTSGTATVAKGENLMSWL